MSTPDNGKVIAILQSNYIPWKGYFDIIAAVDEFVIFDEAQYTRRDWRNRNKIVLDGKLKWLTIPVASKGAFHDSVTAVEIADADWARNHWMNIAHAYARAPYFNVYGPLFKVLYDRAAKLKFLSEINELFLRALSSALGIEAHFFRAESIPRNTSNPTSRLVEICLNREARGYVSGPAGKLYIDRAQFKEAGISLSFANYGGYPEYGQARKTFEHGVSVVDLIMNCGQQAREHLKSFQDRSGFLEAD